jgi:hypothetical protein
LNLFFGALLGANLGTMQSLVLNEYLKLVILLAGTVMVLRMISTSNRRAKVFSILAMYVLLVGAVAFVPALKPKGLADESLHKLVATLATWLLCVLLVEFSPLRQELESGSAREAEEPEGA